MQAAIPQFAEEGFAKASIDRIIEDLDLTKGAVYHHFRDKSQLFEAAFVTVEDRFLGRLETGLVGVDDPRERLATCIDLFLAACREPEYLRIAVLEAPAALGWERWKELEDHRLVGVVAAQLAALHGEQSGDTGSATMVVGAASEAGFELSAVSAPRVASERQRLGGLVMRMVDGLSP